VLATAPDAAAADLDPEDVACLLFTGGTTGAAKAAMVSYRMVAWNTLNTAVHELDRDDVTSPTRRCSTPAGCWSTPCRCWSSAAPWC
jgi:acyl-CoA synthetase (AMP-forming)/AMP-acid ligase II